MPQRATGQAIAAAVLRPRTRSESGPSRGTPSIEANRHDATPVPFDRHMPNIARVYPRVLPPASNSPLPQFPSVRRPSCSGYVDRGAWAIPRSRGLAPSQSLGRSAYARQRTVTLHPRVLVGYFCGRVGCEPGSPRRSPPKASNARSRIARSLVVRSSSRSFRSSIESAIPAIEARGDPRG